MPHTHSTRSASVSVFPDLSAVNHAGELAAAVGALLTIVLVMAVMMLIICGVAWALASAHGNYHAAVRARTGVWVSVGAAALAGAGMAWINFLIDVGRAL